MLLKDDYSGDSNPSLSYPKMDSMKNWPLRKLVP